MFTMQLNKSLIHKSYVILKLPLYVQLSHKTSKASVKLIILKNQKSRKHSLNVTNSVIYGPILKESKKKVNDKKDSKYNDYVNNTETSYHKLESDEITKKQDDTMVEHPTKMRNKSTQSKINEKDSEKLIPNSVENIIFSEKKRESSQIFSENYIEQSPKALPKENLKYKNILPTEISIEEVKRFPLLNLSKEKNLSIATEDNEISSISIFEGGYKKLPSVRHILQETMPPERKLILKKWESNMIMKLGEEGFQNYRQGLLDRGKIIHECIELKLRKVDVSNEQLVGIEHYWVSINKVLKNICNIRLLESRVIHPSLCYHGCIDCMGMYKNTPVVIEFKTSAKPKLTLNSTYDDPLQLAAYMGALNHDHLYDFPNIDSALLVFAYPTGLPAHVHVLSKENCRKYWNQWCLRLSQFFRMQVQ